MNSIDPSTPHAVRAVVFDAVGTVMYPTPSVAEAYQTCIARYCGVRIDLDLVRSTVGKALKARSAGSDLTTSEQQEREFWATLIRELCPSSEGFDECFDALFAHFADPANWQCFADVKGIIPALQDLGLKLAIASNFDRRLHKVCSGLPEISPVESRFVSSLVGFRKPAPQFFRTVSQSIGVPLKNILVVGDDLVNDVDGAIQAGCQAALIDRAKANLSLPADVQRLTSLAELPQLLTGATREETRRV